MSPLFPRRGARAALHAACTAAALMLPVAASSQTPVTAGAVEVRGFTAKSATVVYAAAYGAGLYRSGDAGASWTRITLPGDERYLTAIASNDASYMIVAGEEGLWRTADATVASPAFTKVLSEPVSAVAVAGGTSNTVLVAVKGLGILRSTDAGASFAPANNAGFDSLDMTAIAFDPTNANVAYASAKPNGVGTGGGVFRSGNGGVDWASHLASGLTDRYVTSVAVDSAGTAYVGVLRNCIPTAAPGPCDLAGDVYSRTSGGGTWAATGDFFGVVSLHRDANSGTTIWAGSRGLGLLSGSGTTFNYAFSHDGQQNLFFTGVNAVGTLPGSAVVLKALKGAGVYRSTVVASPRSWTRVAFPGADRVLSASGVGGSPNSLLLGLRAGGVWRSDTAGNAATTFYPPTVTAAQADFAVGAFAGAGRPFVSVHDLAASPSAGSPIYAAAGSVGMFYANDDPAIFRFNGASWGPVGDAIWGVPTGVPWNGTQESGLYFLNVQVFGVTLSPSSDQVAYVAYMGPNFGLGTRSPGGTWATTSPVPGVQQLRKVVASPTNASRLLALSFDDKPAISTNAGSSWTTVGVSHTGFERIRFFSAAENPTDAGNWVAGTNKGVFRSVDSGASWSRVTMANGVFQRLAVNAVGFKSTGRAFAGDFEGNRYCSADKGITWVSAGTKLRAGITGIRVVNGNLYYLTDGAGAFREDGTC